MKSSYDSGDEECSPSGHLLATHEFDSSTNPRHKRWSHLMPWILPTILSMVLLVLLTVQKIGQVDQDLACLMKQAAFSPALEAAVPFNPVKFNGTLDYPSAFRGPPSPEVDAAWETLVNRQSVGAFGISDSDFRKLDQEVDQTTTRLQANQGGQLMASLEVFHQLHCLNLLRQYIDKEYYETRSPSFWDPPDVLRVHVGHCLEMLRQKLTCDVDVGIITYNWVAVRNEPWPNFNTMHMCRNFDGAVKWARAHSVPSNGQPMRKPDGVKGLDVPP